MIVSSSWMGFLSFRGRGGDVCSSMVTPDMGTFALGSHCYRTEMTKAKIESVAEKTRCATCLFACRAGYHLKCFSITSSGIYMYIYKSEVLVFYILISI